MVLAALLAACGGTEPPPAATPVPPQFPQFDDAHLQAGRQVWLGTCKGCHDVGVGGAPPIGDVAAWAPRIGQGAEILHAHALQGFFGPKGTMMPARGGNAVLSDAQVIAAVDYMVAASGGTAASGGVSPADRVEGQQDQDGSGRKR